MFKERASRLLPLLLLAALAAGLAAHLLVAAVERLGSFTHVRSGPATAFAIFALIVHLLVLRRIPRRKPGFESGRSLFAGSVFSVAATTAAALASGLGWMNVWHGADAAAAVISSPAALVSQGIKTHSSRGNQGGGDNGSGAARPANPISGGVAAHGNRAPQGGGAAPAPRSGNTGPSTPHSNRKSTGGGGR